MFLVEVAALSGMVLGNENCVLARSTPTGEEVSGTRADSIFLMTVTEMNVYLRYESVRKLLAVEMTKTMGRRWDFL